MEVGRYSKFDNSIKIKKVKVENDAIQLDYKHVWDGEFKYTDENDDYWRHYSRSGSLYDALDGEAEAIWNID